ncbi:MAG: LPS export ABC transporter periplasmic protein LptC [Bdellovibrionia bacterium]
MKLKNIIYTVLIALLFVEVLIVFPRIIEQEEEQAKAEVQKNESQPIKSENDQKMEGIHLVESQAGARDWELFAEQAEGSQSSGAWTLKKVKVQFYSNNIIEFIVSGDAGNIEGESRNLNIKGNVSITSANGYSFKTPAIAYTSQRRLITSPGPVLMKGPPDKLSTGIELKGTGLKVWVDSTLMEIAGPVSATRKMSDGKLFTVSSGVAKVSGKNQEIAFDGQVGIQYDNVKINGPEASFKYSADNILSSIIMKSGVQFMDQDKSAQANEMIFDLIKNKLNFKGQPKVQQGEDELSGEEIVFLDGGKKVKVERVRARVDNKNK